MPRLQIQHQCHHRTDIPLPSTLLYCLFLSTLFVCSLYAFVPSSIRRLPRDHCLHIRWRSGVVVGVAIVGISTYPWLFCLRSVVNSAGEDPESRRMDDYPLWYRYLGISWQPLQDIKIALHVLILYLGSLACTWLRTYHCMRMLQWENDNQVRKNGSYNMRPTISTRATTELLPTFPNPKYFRRALHQTWVAPTIQSIQSFYNNESYRWIKLRNLAIAPLAEEVIFRACLLPPLLASNSNDGKPMSPTAIVWIGPLFFGIAHLHHFFEQYRQISLMQRSRKNICNLSLGLLLQWAYTTLFGAYVSHVFIRTASLSGVTIAHVICNYMGLPDIGFVDPESNIYCYRWIIVVVYLVGVWYFVAGFDSMVFPTTSVLPSLLYPQR